MALATTPAPTPLTVKQIAAIAVTPPKPLVVPIVAAPKPPAPLAIPVSRPATTAPAPARVTPAPPVTARVPAGTPAATSAPAPTTARPSWWQGSVWGIPVWVLLLVVGGAAVWYFRRKLPSW